MRIPFPRDGCPFSQERVSPTRGRPPLWRGRAFHFPRDGGQFSDRRVPSSEERAPRIPGTGSQFPRDSGTQCGGRVVPHIRRTGTHCLSRGGHRPSPSEWRVPLFQRDGGPVSDVWLPLAARTVTPSSEGRGPLFRGTGSPFIVECRCGNPFPRQTSDVPLENPRSATCRWRSQAHGLDPLASICETNRALLPHTGVPSVCGSWCGGPCHAASSRISVVESIISQFEKLTWLRTAKDERAL